MLLSCPYYYYYYYYYYYLSSLLVGITYSYTASIYRDQWEMTSKQHKLTLRQVNESDGDDDSRIGECRKVEK